MNQFAETPHKQELEEMSTNAQLPYVDVQDDDLHEWLSDAISIP